MVIKHLFLLVRLYCEIMLGLLQMHSLMWRLEISTRNGRRGNWGGTVEFNVSCPGVDGRNACSEFDEEGVVILRSSLLYYILLDHVPCSICICDFEGSIYGTHFGFKEFDTFLQVSDYTESNQQTFIRDKLIDGSREVSVQG
jgi:hypothetical protein